MDTFPDPYNRLIGLSELAFNLGFLKRKSEVWLREMADAGLIPSIRPPSGPLRFNLRAVQDALLALAASATGHVDPAAAGRGGSQLALRITAAAGGKAARDGH